MTLENKQVSSDPNEKRNLVLISGYYGFSNLGDEAILEVIIDELKRIMPSQNIVALSNSPAETEKTFGIKAADRWNIGALTKLLPHTKLFISGGGGLFQDIVSVKSPFFYGAQILIARALGAPVMVFAQGIGPLKTTIGRTITRLSLARSNFVAVRDQKSVDLLREWGLAAQLTADPVWALQAKPLPPILANALSAKQSNSPLRVGLSLRVSSNFTVADVEPLARCLAEALPADAEIVPLVLQPSQDAEILKAFSEHWRALNRRITDLDLSAIERPSQWITLLKHMDLVIAMRLHCAIMSLISAVPTVAIAYDPKVSHIAEQFGLPTLNLAQERPNQAAAQAWTATVKRAVDSRKTISKHCAIKARDTRNMACQNFALLARILEKHT